ncbi:hypothetical protein F4778DRAFT_761969 [Xylariomycetidae sp. FL2044]|nr:hypothetical protein F4778DRAFT_761969 [Xylariomycetidae sp. FL2044]
MANQSARAARVFSASETVVCVLLICCLDVAYSSVLIMLAITTEYYYLLPGAPGTRGSLGLSFLVVKSRTPTYEMSGWVISPRNAALA